MGKNLQRLSSFFDPLVVRFAGRKQLARIARSGVSPTVRLAAVGKLEDHHVLAEVAKRDEDYFVRQAAFARLPEGALRRQTAAYRDPGAVYRLAEGDEQVLIDIAKTAFAPQRRAAIMNPHLKDEAVIFDIARSDEDQDVRVAAVERLNDQEHLLAIARGRDSTVGPDRQDWSSLQERIAAVKRLADQDVLTHIALHNPDPRVRIAAVERIRDLETLDQGVLIQIALLDPDSAVRIAAVARIRDLEIVTRLARSDSDYTVRRSAVERLTDNPVLEEIAATDDAESVRLSAILRARYGGDPQQFILRLLDSAATPEEKSTQIRALWMVIQENSLVPASDIIFCECGYPIQQSYSDGGSGPIWDFVRPENDPFDEYTRYFKCPRCNRHFDTITT